MHHPHAQSQTCSTAERWFWFKSTTRPSVVVPGRNLKSQLTFDYVRRPFSPLQLLEQVSNFTICTENAQSQVKSRVSESLYISISLSLSAQLTFKKSYPFPRRTRQRICCKSQCLNSRLSPKCVAPRPTQPQVKARAGCRRRLPHR